MWDAWESAIDSLFVGPIWPASVLVLVVVSYLLLSLLGATDFDGPDFSIHGDGWESLGAGTLRWFQLGSVPIVLWLGCFSVVNWLLAYGLWHFYESSQYRPTWTESAFLAGRNAIIAALVTKLTTGPLAKYFVDARSYNEETIIGERCVISSAEATPFHGQAKYATGGAPLLLNIRTDGATIIKGTPVMIIAYDIERRLYTVTQESSSSAATSPETQA